jgi:pimeloyl-ACP methyl ester carboxylesterase
MSETTFEVVSDGNRLDGGIEVPAEPRGAVLLLHGVPSINPPEPGDLGYPGLAERLAGQGFAAAWIDMRAARSSPGYFSIEGWVRDATAAARALGELEELTGLKVAIVGSSAGGAVATVALRRGAPAHALALLAAPAEWVSYAGHPREGLRRITEEAGMAVSPEAESDPAAWAEEFTSVTTRDAIGELDVPILIVHGTDDPVVPVEHAHRIAERAPAAELHIIEGAGHQLRKVPEAMIIVERWLDRVL